VPTADVAGGDAAVVVAATGLALLLDQRRVRRALVQIRRHHADGRATAGRGGLECHQCHGLVPQAEAVITSIAWPSARVTYALRQSPRRPWRNLKDLDLPFTFTTFTASTLTSKIFSTAAFTSALVAVFATSKTY